MTTIWLPQGQDKKFWAEAENEIVGEHNVRDGGHYIYIKSKNSIRLSFFSQCLINFIIDDF